ncbi:NlpE N-terminal domain-containing protein [Mesonia phycicola]|uniref:NlpE N-terminal domain-containing protein n=1 Tax=Mesonia phycicola TaxID=579105 RepID=A0A1M6BW45_9FLAO|nr:copper resistance protein NlpE [Mesonia phycicola]SHI52979.1 NlpE N-terminal domain-containing protein [Mesonia phycicola]
MMNFKSFLLLVIGVISFIACNSNSSIDYIGVYEGVLPCEDCDAIKAKLTLKEDQFYTLYETYSAAEGDEIKRMSGKFEWEEEKGVFSIEQVGAMPLYFKIVDNKIMHLNFKAEPFKDNQQHILMKIESSEE